MNRKAKYRKTLCHFTASGVTVQTVKGVNPEVIVNWTAVLDTPVNGAQIDAEVLRYCEEHGIRDWRIEHFQNIGSESARRQEE